MGAFDETGTDGEIVFDGGLVIQRVGAIGEVAVGVAHGSVGVGRVGRFEMLGEFGNDKA